MLILIAVVVVVMVLVLLLALAFMGPMTAAAILKALDEAGGGPLRVSELKTRTGRSSALVISALLNLEKDGYVSTPGSMRRASAANNKTLFHLTPEGRQKAQSN